MVMIRRHTDTHTVNNAEDLIQVRKQKDLDTNTIHAPDFSIHLYY